MRELYLHRRFFMVLWGAVFVSLFAFVFPSLLFGVGWLLGIFGVVVLVDFILLYSFGRPVQAKRLVGDKLANGEENEVGIWVRNHYPFRIAVTVIDECPVEFQQRNICMDFSLAPEEETQQKYILKPVKRGEYSFGRVRIFVSTRLALIQRRYSFEEKKTVSVYPSFLCMRKYELLAFAGFQTGGGVKRMPLPGVSTSFEQIKPYVQGDDPRAINWKATARSNRLMINTYTAERSQQVYCLIDKGRTMQAPFRGMTMLDYAINATLVLSDIVLKKGDRAGLLTFSDKQGTFIKAGNQRLQLNRINEALYSQQTRFLESDFEQLCATVSRWITTRSLLVLFTNFDTVSGMKRHLPGLKRLAANHLLLVVLFENTEINQALHLKPESMRDIYFKILVGDFILEKKKIAGELKKAGIYTLLTEPQDLTANTLNRYLELKERGLI
ncbi:DUF58 domain-containing protein [Odoribacter sp. Z80]|uniref:DUF58 domain-containing protein n=1 Tax=Odoribacter sp. Z80 TaxID=2304575 RepID=UPI0013799D0F|nr:DUF58 domain-containing protein [Odoribacter sp. Z80]NCE72615.1 DUF58 domain-containing protein [Odoribacter sp. Z80]